MKLFFGKVKRRLKQARRSLRSLVWNCVNSLQQSPLFSKGGRSFLLKRFGCTVDPSSYINSNVFVGAPIIEMGKNSIINVGCFLDGSAKIVLREYVRIGPYVKILTGTHTYRNSVIRRGPGCRDINLPVTFERGCWIGVGSIILPGVTIGEGCIVAAGSIVTKSTFPNGLYAGNPAVRVKDLSIEDDFSSDSFG